jgi:hypothetical protein
MTPILDVWALNERGKGQQKHGALKLLGIFAGEHYYYHTQLAAIPTWQELCQNNVFRGDFVQH